MRDEGRPPISLVLGGARSGKSEVAERIAASLPPPVTYLATADPGDDADFRLRIAAHRSRRPGAWRTLETGPDLVGALRATEGAALVDSLGSWVASTRDFAADPGALCEALVERVGATVLVSEEVGLGVHPSTRAGGLFRDALGTVNQAVAAVAGDVLLVVAGRVLRLDDLARGRQG